MISLTIFLQCGINFNWKHLCVFLGSIKVVANCENGAYVYLAMQTSYILLDQRTNYQWLYQQWLGSGFMSTVFFLQHLVDWYDEDCV